MATSAPKGDFLKRVLGFIKKEPAHFANTETGAAAKAAWAKRAEEHPDVPFFAGLVMPKRLKSAWDKGFRHVDERLGEEATRVGQKEGMFIKKKFVEDPLHPGNFKEHHYPSITAPLGTVSKFGTPILASMYVMDKLKKDKGNNGVEGFPLEKGAAIGYHRDCGIPQLKENVNMANDKNMEQKVLVSKSELEKTASALKAVKAIKARGDELEKTASLRERAEKVAFKLVDRGSIPNFGNWESFNEKVASLMGEDLAVIEKALELNPASLSLGSASTKSTPTNALEDFVLND